MKQLMLELGKDTVNDIVQLRRIQKELEQKLLAIRTSKISTSVEIKSLKQKIKNTNIQRKKLDNLQRKIASTSNKLNKKYQSGAEEIKILGVKKPFTDDLYMRLDASLLEEINRINSVKADHTHNLMENSCKIIKAEEQFLYLKQQEEDIQIKINMSISRQKRILEKKTHQTDSTIIDPVEVVKIIQKGR